MYQPLPGEGPRHVSRLRHLSPAASSLERQDGPGPHWSLAAQGIELFPKGQRRLRAQEEHQMSGQSSDLGPRQKRGRRKTDPLSPLEGSQNPDSRRQSPRGHGLEPVLLVGQQHPTDILGLPGWASGHPSPPRRRHR